MASIVFTNNASSLLKTPISAVDTTIELETGFGSRFPNPGASEFFYATLEDDSGNFEVVQCTARSNDLLTVIRGRDNTNALTFNATTTRVDLRVCAAVVEEFVQVNGDIMAGDLDFNGNSILDAVITGSLTQITGGEIVGVPIRGTTGVSANEIAIDGSNPPTIGGVAILTAASDLIPLLDTTGVINFTSATVGVEVPAGAYLRLSGPTAANYIQLAHDDTDVNVTGANTTDINLGGITGDVIFGTDIDLDLADNDLIRPNFIDFSVAVNSVTASASPTDIDYTAGSYVELGLTTLTDRTLTFSNLPASGTLATMRLRIAQDGTGSKTITWPAGIRWLSGVEPVLSTGANEVDVIDLWTSDAGTTWYGAAAINFAVPA